MFTKNIAGIFGNFQWMTAGEEGEIAGTQSLQGLTPDIYKNKTRRLTGENKTSLNSISDLVHFSSENKSTIFDEIVFLFSSCVRRL